MVCVEDNWMQIDDKKHTIMPTRAEDCLLRWTKNVGFFFIFLECGFLRAESWK